MSNSKKVTAGAGTAAEVRPPPVKRRLFTAAEKLRIVKRIGRTYVLAASVLT